MTNIKGREITALVVRQWLKGWDHVKFSSKEMRRKPEPYFYIFQVSANDLRKLSNIYRRTTSSPRDQDKAVQRKFIPERSDEIKKFVQGGFPWSELSKSQQQSSDFRDLQMPGWLPTAIIANILAPGTNRGKLTINDQDTIRIDRYTENVAKLVLPENSLTDNWIPEVAPLEIIDGQHRLLAFEKDQTFDGSYELPVVAFYDLDITWQAYLFYMINIKPKRIDASLAYDLYPILRIQDWLEKTPETAKIYRETRAQELTEVLWSHPESPWRNRISMLGERKKGIVTQAAFIRSLISSYVKRGRPNGIGGLFGSQIFTDSEEYLPWDRAQQAALLILVWQTVADAAKNCTQVWANHLRELISQSPLPSFEPYSTDNAFVSEYSLLSTDQGVRGILQITNDMCYAAIDSLDIDDWDWDEPLEEGTLTKDIVTEALKTLKQLNLASYLSNIALELMQFDWRTSSTPQIDIEIRQKQMVFRGSGGYRELRRQLVEILQKSENILIQQSAHKIASYYRL